MRAWSATVSIAAQAQFHHTRSARARRPSRCSAPSMLAGKGAAPSSQAKEQHRARRQRSSTELAGKGAAPRSASEGGKPSSPGRQDAPAPALPPVTGDFYALVSCLGEEDQALIQRVRAFMEAEVAPIINRYWIRAEFPFELIPKLAALE